MPARTDALLRYRPWRGTPHGPGWAAVALARSSVVLMARRRLYWGLFALVLLVFFFFFYGQYLVAWLPGQVGDSVAVGGVKVPAAGFARFLDRLNLGGTAHTFGNFVWFEGYVVVVLLALTGSVLVGNDFHHNSLPFYLSKPIGRRHYVLGKCLGVGAVVNLATTVPAVVLWVEAGLLGDWRAYYLDNLALLAGILGYGLVLTVCLSLLVVATAVWVRQTVPMVMVWMGLFVLLRLLSGWVVDGLKAAPEWRLLDLWNDLYLVGLWCLGADPGTVRPQPQPSYGEAAAVVAGVCAACVLFLRRRVRAVDVIGG